MSLFEPGRLCVKLAGRDAGRKCVVVEAVDAQFVMVDGDVRRKKVNMKHLEPLDQIIKIKSMASHETVKKEFEALGLPVWDTNSKKVADRVKRQKKKSAKVKEVKPVKKAAEKKVEKKVEATEVKATA